MMKHVEISLQENLNNVRDLIFMSTYDSLKKGNMLMFVNHLNEVASYQNIKEFSLLDKTGRVKYSSHIEKYDTFDYYVKNLKHEKTVIDDHMTTYYLPVITVGYCTRCHVKWVPDTINSFYKLTMNTHALNNFEKITNYSTSIILFGAILSFFILFISFYYLQEINFNEIVTISEKKYRSLFENMIDVQYVLNENGKIILISPSGVHLLKYNNEDDLIERHFSDILLNEAYWNQLIKLMNEKGNLSNHEMILKDKFMNILIVETNIRKTVDDHNTVQYEGVFKDITERKNSEEQMLLLASVFNHSSEGIVITNHNDIIQRINPAFTAITGYTTPDVINKTPQIFQSDKQTGDTYENIWTAVNSNGSWSGEIWNKRKSGEIFPQWLSINCVKDQNGDTSHYIRICHDITELKNNEEELKFHAYHDNLTGLPNRQLFHDRLKMAIAYGQRHKEKVALMFIDLDNFKTINDSLGHDIGDLLLIEVSNRLKKCAREEDTVARLGGDEFTIVLPNITERQSAITVAERVLHSLKQQMYFHSHTLTIGASIGITIFPDDSENLQQLIKNADMAMYRAKELGKSNYYSFTEAMHSEITRKLSLERSLTNAVELDEIKVYYQPKLSLKTGAIVGAEALVRWHRMKADMIMPHEFIPIAEETGIILDIGKHVILTACHQLKAWHNAGFTELSIAVNLSAKQFLQPNIVEMIMGIIEITQVDPSKLKFEITESVAMQHVDKAENVMNSLARIGIKLSLDDFGTGYSSLGYLKQFPLDEIKIDKSFIRDITTEIEDDVLVDGIISLASSLSLNVVAEGVENMEQLHILKQKNCNEIQGFLFSRPVPANQFTKLLLDNVVLSI